MTETKTADDIKQRKPRQKKSSELDEFKLWLSSFEMTSAPSLHINGRDFSTAVMTVDFGTPLDESHKLTAEQSNDLVTKLKAVTKSLYKSEVNVRVQNDTSNGIWWTSVN